MRGSLPPYLRQAEKLAMVVLRRGGIANCCCASKKMHMQAAVVHMDSATENRGRENKKERPTDFGISSNTCRSRRRVAGEMSMAN